MIRLTPQRRYHVSNRLALLATLALLMVTYLSVGDGNSLEPKFEEQTVVVSNAGETQTVSNTSNKRKLSISLLLFGRG